MDTLRNRKCMSLDSFVSLVDFINENHSFLEQKGKRIKYITPTYDTRTEEIFAINVRLAGEGKSFALVNEDRDKDLERLVMDWLDSGSWDD